MKKLLLLAIFVLGLHAESVTELTKACNLSDARACGKLGGMLLLSNKVKKDYVSSLKPYYKRTHKQF